MARIQNIANILEYNKSLLPGISQVVKPVFEAFNINSFVYASFKGDKMLRICSDDMWLRYYLENELYNLPYYEREINELTYKKQHIIVRNDSNNEVTSSARRFGLWHGLTVYKKNKSEIELWNFTTTVDNSQIINLYLNNIDLLNRFIFYLKNKLPQAFIFGDNKCLITRNNSIISNTTFKLCSSFRNHIIEKTSLEKLSLLNSDGITLTRGESECLYLLYLGRSVKEIGRLLNISPKTVETHINNFKVKVKYGNKLQITQDCQHCLSEYYSKWFLESLL